LTHDRSERREASGSVDGSRAQERLLGRARQAGAGKSGAEETAGRERSGAQQRRGHLLGQAGGPEGVALERETRDGGHGHVHLLGERLLVRVAEDGPGLLQGQALPERVGETGLGRGRVRDLGAVGDGGERRVGNDGSDAERGLNGGGSPGDVKTLGPLHLDSAGHRSTALRALHLHTRLQLNPARRRQRRGGVRRPRVLGQRIPQPGRILPRQRLGRVADEVLTEPGTGTGVGRREGHSLARNGQQVAFLERHRQSGTVQSSRLLDRLAAPERSAAGAEHAITPRREGERVR
jgi:hypothetical protein